jgi:hypothetical protein
MVTDLFSFIPIARTPLSIDTHIFSHHHIFPIATAKAVIAKTELSTKWSNVIYVIYVIYVAQADNRHRTSDASSRRAGDEQHERARSHNRNYPPKHKWRADFHFTI